MNTIPQAGAKGGCWALKPSEGHQQIVNDHAQKGWRLRPIFDNYFSAHGNASFFELNLKNGFQPESKRISHPVLFLLLQNTVLNS